MVLTAIVSQRLLPKAGGRGRAMAVEVLRNVHASAALIREGKTHQLYSVIETGTKDGMCTLDASLIRLYRRGLVSVDEARLHMHNPQILLDVAMKEAELPRQTGAKANLFD